MIGITQQEKSNCFHISFTRKLDIGLSRKKKTGHTGRIHHLSRSFDRISSVFSFNYHGFFLREFQFELMSFDFDRMEERIVQEIERKMSVQAPVF
jgi:hypothetical protein